ncbi:BED-type domain-containing protein [Citrus sinensis]|uniref:BED-type domain-containing protein n=1 Tax=Citrus sinensis TaxID=2711 RepID=A0ACB8N9T0_CITSI|nr:BED-type domain-containing protein [Citrus sinensis]
MGPLHHGQRWHISSSVVTPSKPSVPHGFKRLVARCLGPSRSPSKAQSPQSLTLTVFKHGDAVKALSEIVFEFVEVFVELESGGVACEIVKSLKMFADDFEHEVEFNDNENDSATIVTGGNKRKKSSSSKPPLPRKKIAPRSTVWQHFTRVPNDHTKCKCNYCGQEFECGTVGYGTSTLRTHNRERCQKFKDLQKSQTTLTQDVGSDEVVARGFSQEACRRATVKMIVLDELPFSVVENPGFRHFCSVAAPRYLLPPRRTISRDTLEMYLEEKAKLNSLLVGNKQRVSLTTDIWTSITTASYMVITAHFIDRDWNLHRKIISFNTVNDHSSETIGKQLEKCLIDWGIERVFTVTVDNASPNEGALRYLIDRVKTWRDDGLVLNGDYLHVRCCAHILNLIVTEGLKELEQSLVSVRNAVKYVRSSTARMQAFQIRVQQEKINCRGSVILDCPTRWNSTYSMLNTSLKFKPTFDRMTLEDKLYDAYFNEKKGGKKKKEGPPLYSDWENTRRIVKFLKTFHDATLQFSSSLKVTSNICFNLICQIEQSLGSLSASNDSLLGFMAIKMKEKFNKYWDGCFKINKLLIVASVLDPRGKMKFATHCFEKLYGKDSAKCVEMKEMIKNLLIKLYESYNAQYKPGGSGSASGSASGSTSGSQNLASGSGSNFWDLGDDDDVMIEDPFSEFRKAVAVSEGSPELSNELDLYLMEKTEKITKSNLSTKFDILLWWRVNSANYPILSSIARDVLAIPVSTVASESAFSTGGRILDQYRSSLTPDMVEALVLLQNWLRTSLFVDTTADLNKLVEDNEFMDQLAEELRKSTTADQLCSGILKPGKLGGVDVGEEAQELLQCTTATCLPNTPRVLTDVILHKKSRPSHTISSIRTKGSLLTKKRIKTLPETATDLGLLRRSNRSMALEWVVLGYAAAAEAVMVLMLTLPGLDGLRRGLVAVTRNLLKPFLSVVPFCLFLLLDIYWKYETRPSCEGDSCSPTEHLRHQKSIMKSQRNALLIASALVFYWLLYSVTHLVVKIEQLNQRIERLKNKE